jgi:hypothetical protein
VRSWSLLLDLSVAHVSAVSTNVAQDGRVFGRLFRRGLLLGMSGRFGQELLEVF